MFQAGTTYHGIPTVLALVEQLAAQAARLGVLGATAAASTTSPNDRDSLLLDRARAEGEAASARAAASQLPQARAEAAHLRGLLQTERAAHEAEVKEASSRAEALRVEVESLRQRQVGIQ